MPVPIPGQVVPYWYGYGSTHGSYLRKMLVPAAVRRYQNINIQITYLEQIRSPMPFEPDGDYQHFFPFCIRTGHTLIVFSPGLMILTFIRAIQNWQTNPNHLYTILVNHNLSYYACGLRCLPDHFGWFMILAILVTRMCLYLWQVNRQTHGSGDFTHVPMSDLSFATSTAMSALAWEEYLDGLGLFNTRSFHCERQRVQDPRFELTLVEVKIGLASNSQDTATWHTPAPQRLGLHSVLSHTSNL
ncbi:hypothetical protein EDB19DRAFT_1833520 [Suillus lakei]|nr:hypothetical protein EDB19DRAFT_1833520 [Suillus lakei]